MNTVLALRGVLGNLRLFPSLLSACALAAACPTVAHDSYSSYIQHRVVLAPGAKYLDVTVVLTFFEEWSLRERRQMDSDQDGRITRAEREGYLKKLSSELPKRIRVQAAGHPLALATLYEPQLDLLQSDQAAPGHHQLTLSFFAPWPAAPKAGDVFLVEDALWPDAQSFGSFQVKGRDGSAWASEKPWETSLDRTAQGKLTLRIKCLRVPSQTTQGPAQLAP
jgi:hypothetical protein